MLIIAAECVLVFAHQPRGLLVHALLLIGLTIYGAIGRNSVERHVATALLLIPLSRLLAFAMPLSALPQGAWYPSVVGPLLIATWIVTNYVHLRPKAIGRAFKDVPLQLMIAGAGIGLGVIEYSILKPPALMSTFTWLYVGATALSLTIFTGFAEEWIFRGLLQSLSLAALGRSALVYVSTLFAALHLGHLSATNVLFVFVVGLLFAHIVYWSGSLLGVVLAHSLTNITLFLVMPYLAQYGTPTMYTVLGWAIVSGALLSAGAVGTLVWRAAQEQRLLVPAVRSLPITQPLRSRTAAAITQPLQDVSAAASTQPLLELPQARGGINTMHRVVRLQLAMMRARFEGYGREQLRWLLIGGICLLAVLTGGIARYTSRVLNEQERTMNTGGLPFAPPMNSAQTNITPTAPAAALVPASPAPSSTVPPTVTPTATDVPTSTPTTAPTNVAAPTPEPVPLANELVRFVEDTFTSPASGWPTRTTSSSSIEYADGGYQLTLNGQTSVGVSTAFSTTNYRLSVDVLLTEGRAGLVFLSAEPATFYRLLIDTEGRYAIERLQQDTGATTFVVDWTDQAALQRGTGVLNRLRVQRQGTTIAFFSNDQPLTTFTVPNEEVSNRNQYGFVLTSQTQQGEALFDNLVGDQLPGS